MIPNLIRPFGISCFVVTKDTPQPQYLLIRRCSKHLTGDWQMVSGSCFVEQEPNQRFKIARELYPKQ